MPDVTTIAAVPAGAGTPPASARRPSASRTWVGRSCASSRSRSAAGAAGFSGRIASPASHAATTASASAGPASERGDDRGFVGPGTLATLTVGVIAPTIATRTATRDGADAMTATA